jgi:hypothetical protein
MLNPITVQELAKAHQRDQRELWKEADVRRMARQVKAAQPAQLGLVERIAAEVGMLLMGVGRRLTEHRALPG